MSNLGVKIYPQIGDENPSKDYSVSVNGKPIFVYRARVSAAPFNQVWLGYQRPMAQTEMASFAYWDISEPINLEVISNRPIESVDIRPYSYGIKPVVDDDKITFQMSKPGYVTIEMNGYHHALHLFVSPIEEDKPNPDDPNVRYFGPGIHEAGRLDLKSGETVYIAGGAIVHGLIRASEVSDISILGRGILDTSTFEREGNPGPISLYGCKNVTIDGIIIRDSNVWAVTPRDCQYLALALLFAAMFFFAVGDVFKTGTHKAMILYCLAIQGRSHEKTKVYGDIRSKIYSPLTGTCRLRCAVPVEVNCDLKPVQVERMMQVLEFKTEAGSCYSIQAL